MINIAEPIASKPGKSSTMCLVIHAAETPAECVIDGRGYIIPPNEIFEVPSITCTDHNNNGPYEYTTPADQVMQTMLRLCWAWGLVEVPVEKKQGKYGVQYGFDEAKAHESAKRALIEAEDQIITDYVAVQRARMSANLPALAPSGRAALVIEKRRIDLDKEFNIKPIGYNTVAKAAAANEEMAAMHKRQADLEAENADMKKKLNQLLKSLGEK